MKAHNEEGSTGACAWLRVCVYARTCVRHDGCMCVRACVCACACARAQVLCVCIVRVLCASCSCMRVRVVRALCVSACARVRADGGACLRLLAPKGVPRLAAITALTRRLERGRSAGAAVGGGVACCWVGRLWLGRERPAARWGDSSSGMACHSRRQQRPRRPATRTKAIGWHQMSAVCTESATDPYAVQTEAGRAHALMINRRTGRGRAPGNQRVRASGPRRTVC